MDMPFTKNFIQKIVEQRNRWMNSGYDASPGNRSLIVDHFNSAYTKIGFEAPEIHWCTSPAAICRQYDISDTVMLDLWNMEINTLPSFLRVAHNVETVLGKIEEQIRVALFVMQPLRALNLIKKELGIKDDDSIFDKLLILQENLAYYEFLKKSIGTGSSIILNEIRKISAAYSFYALMVDKVIISENPIKSTYQMRTAIGNFGAATPTHRDNDPFPVLHCDGGAALEYSDGFSVYALNGICVPREVAITPHDQIDPRLVIETADPDVRHEIVRKIGNERLCDALKAKVIDQQGDYELLLLELNDGHRQPYLKMKNPSIGVYHIEGVSPEIETIDQALAWRNGTTEHPLKLT